MSRAFSSPILRQAHAIQAEACDILGRKMRGEPLTEEEVAAWMDNRRSLAAADLTTPIDALAVAHGLLQAIECTPRFADDAESLNYMAGEMTLAALSLIQFLEDCTGVTREALGLFDNYTGPRRH